MLPPPPPQEVPTDYFRQAVFNLQLGGISIKGIKDPILKYLCQIYSACILFIFAYFYTAAEIIHVCESTHLEDLLFIVSYTMVHLIACAKIAVLLIKRTSIKTSLQTIEQGRFLPNIERGGPQEITLIKEAVAKTNFQVRIWWAVVLIMLSNRMIWIVLNPTLTYVSQENPNVTVTIRQLPYATSYLLKFDVQKSPFYELVFVHQCVSIWMFGWWMGNADHITNGLIIHLTAQFKIVANAFAMITEKATQCNDIKPKQMLGLNTLQNNKGPFLENYKKYLKDCIQHHQDTLNLAENMEQTFNVMFLIQFLGCLVAYSCQLYQLSLLPMRSTEFISMTCFFFALLLQLLAFCWNGNEMSIASEAIANEVYNTDWIPADKEVKNLILITLKRAQKPVYITAGKFSTLSMATFVMILRGSVSYFTVLLNVNEEKEG